MVPSQPVLKQWKSLIIKCGLGGNVHLYTVAVAARDYESLDCDMLVIDEIHTIPTPKNKTVLKIGYKIILGLTATFERLDGKHSIINAVAPVCDEITIEEGVENNWTANHNVYRILLDIDDIDTYNTITKKFNAAFEYFRWNFKDAMNCYISKDALDEYSRDMVESMLPVNRMSGEDYHKEYHRVRKETIQKAAQFMRSMRARKEMIYHHPKKIDIVRKIIDSRPGKKGITFACTIEDAYAVERGSVYASVGNAKNVPKKTKKQYDEILKRFKEEKGGVINTVRALSTGFDCPEIEYAIMFGFNSSETTGIQSRGRSIRINDLTKNKHAEIFYVVIRDTVDEKWFQSCIGNQPYLTILEEDLDKFLRGEKIRFAPNKTNKTVKSRY